MANALDKLTRRIDATIEVIEESDVAYRVKWRGKFVKTQSGKTAWRRIGDAKSAFRNDINEELTTVLRESLGEYPRSHEKDTFFQSLIDTGLVEFVPVKG